MRVLPWINKSVIASVLFFVSAQASAQWDLDAAQSELSFITVKAEHVAEVHSFTRLEGELSREGAVQLSIDLTSVETGISVRNERMQSMLFETGMYPRARVSANIDVDPITELSLGESVILDVEFILSLHGKELVFSTPLRATRVIDGVRVSTTKPIIVNADAFDLVAGVESLREIAGLPSISLSVPVAFSLSFVNQ